MPTTRKSTGNTRGPTKGQSILPFASKVTKNVPRDTQKADIAPSLNKIEPVAEKKPALEEVVLPEEPENKEESKVEEEPEVLVPEKSEVELKAEKISDAQLSKYWKGIEKERIAPRVHQEGLSVNEKVLRYFDVSSQYGPCIGIDRMKRWQRANRLDLEPPVEVLAVLLKNKEKDNNTAHMDKILGSISGGTA